MEQHRNSLESFKHALDTQGFISPMLGSLEPNEKLRRPSSMQEIFGYVLEGDLTLVTHEEDLVYSKHEIFFIDGNVNFEIHSGVKGVEYLFAFKHKS